MTRPTHAFAPPRARKSPNRKRDSFDEAAEKVHVWQRDRYCIASAIRGTIQECDGPLQVDHVRASGALSKKSVTHRSNMVLLCAWHHKLKTEYGRTWRPLLLAYLARVEVGA